MLQPVSLWGPQEVQTLPVLSAALPTPQSQKRPLQPFRTTAALLEISGKTFRGLISLFPINRSN